MQNFLVKNKKIADKRTNNTLSSIIKKDLKLVNNFLTSNIKSEVPLIPLLSEYLLQSGGKRIRPALTILFSKLFGYKYGTRHIHLSACIEFIHMASLLHDDVVDESDLRRGKKTANKIWGNKASVLVGDYLFSKAFQIMVADKNIDILKNLSETSKTLAQGEVMQLSISCVNIEQHYQQKYNHRHIDVEFAKDTHNGEIYIVQARPLTTFKEVETVYTQYEISFGHNQILSGIAVGDKIYSGTVKVIQNLNDNIEFNEGDILCTKYTSPDWEPLMKKAGAILTDFGGRTSHASIICREWGKCCIVGLKNATKVLENDEKITASCA